MNENILSPDEAMVLQQVYEDGEDDIRSLAYELGVTRQNVIAEALKLEQKGLLDFQHSFDGLLIKVSRRGKRVIRQLWPEAHITFA
jgi:DNA-binding MarR family transcriptional regulator